MVTFLRRKLVRGTYYWSLVESYRDGGKVKQRIVSSLGNTTTAIQRIISDPDLKHFLPQIEPYILQVFQCQSATPRILHYRAKSNGVMMKFESISTFGNP